MQDVIRDIDTNRDVPDNEDRSRTALWRSIGIILLLAILVAAVVTAIMLRQTLPVEGLILCAGIGLMAVIGLFMIRASKRNQGLEDRRQADRENIYSGAFFRSSSPSLIVRSGKPVHANAAYLALADRLGVPTDAGAPPSIDRLFSAAGKHAASAIFRLHHVNASTQMAEEDIEMTEADGSFHRYRLITKRLRDDAPVFLWQVTDVTRSDFAEEALMSEAPVGLFSISKKGRILATNSVLDRWLGIEGPRPNHIREFIETPEALLDSPAQDGRIVRCDTRLMTRKGIVTPTIMVGCWQALNSGEMVANVALYGHSSMNKAKIETDISDAALPVSTAAANTKTNLAELNHVQAPIAMLELSGNTLADAVVLSANPAFERMSGGITAQKQVFSDIFKVDQMEHRFLKLRPDQCVADKPYDATLTSDNPNGSPGLAVSVYIVPGEGDPARFYAYLVDVSARKSLEAQLVQSQKMQAIGQLAAGVAHDFNNLLTAIRLNVDELLQRHPVGDPSYPELQNINATGARAAALVKKLLAFSRKQTRRMERLDVTETLSDMVMTLKQTLGEKAKLTMIHARDLPPVMADKSQIDTVLMNLCVNARDAMADQGGGDITITSKLLPRQDISEPLLSDALSAIPGDDFVVISVADTGTGMSEDVKSKIFEPFFTTKEQGKGTGLGLATVYGIVEQTGGYLDVQSALGKGTTFRIFLPAAPLIDSHGEDIVVSPKPVATERPPADLAGQGNILFVEDEISVRLIAAKSLRKRGYNVVEAEDGEDALERIDEAEEPFDLMISDVVMPGMDGPTLLKEGREKLGKARIVFISGYAEEEFSDLLSEEPDVTFLPKPFTLEQLAEKVKSQIGEAK